MTLHKCSKIMVKKLGKAACVLITLLMSVGIRSEATGRRQF